MEVTTYRAFQVACNWAMSCRSSHVHVIKLKLSSQLIGQFGHVTASASCKQPEKHGIDLPMPSEEVSLYVVTST